MKNEDDASGSHTSASQWCCIVLFVATIAGLILWSLVSTWKPWTKSELAIVSIVAALALGVYIGEKGATRK